MSDVAYRVAIVGGGLSDNESRQFEQIEELDRWVRVGAGKQVGPWEYQFPTLDAAKAFAHRLRQMDLTFDDISITTVDGRTGEDLKS